jgi:hypothetical protein
MRTVRLPFLIVAVAAAPVTAEHYECVVKGGVYKVPSHATLSDAFVRDKSLVDAKFVVDRESGRIIGTPLFSNANDTVKVLRNVREDGYQELTVLSLSKEGEATVLNLVEFEGKWTFTFYVQSFSILLSGEARSIGE